MLGACLLVLGGCIQSARPEWVRHYTLASTGPAAAGTSSATPSGKAILLIARIDVPPWLTGNAMYYRLEYRHENTLAAYGRADWIAPPAALLEPLVQNAIAAAGGWRAVLGPDDPANPDVILHLRLDDFSQAFMRPQDSKGIILATATLIDAHDNDTLAQTRFQVEAAAPTPDAEGGVKALAQAADQLAREVQRWVDAAAERRSGK